MDDTSKYKNRPDTPVCSNVHGRVCFHLQNGVWETERRQQSFTTSERSHLFDSLLHVIADSAIVVCGDFNEDPILMRKLIF